MSRPARPWRREPRRGSVVPGHEPAQVVGQQLFVEMDHDEPAIRPPLDGGSVEPHAPTSRQICPPEHPAGLQELDVEPLIRNGNRRRSHPLKITPQTRPILPEPG